MRTAIPRERDNRAASVPALCGHLADGSRPASLPRKRCCSWGWSPACSCDDRAKSIHGRRLPTAHFYWQCRGFRASRGDIAGTGLPHSTGASGLPPRAWCHDAAQPSSGVRLLQRAVLLCDGASRQKDNHVRPGFSRGRFGSCGPSPHPAAAYSTITHHLVRNTCVVHADVHGFVPSSWKLRGWTNCPLREPSSVCSP